MFCQLFCHNGVELKNKCDFFPRFNRKTKINKIVSCVPTSTTLEAFLKEKEYIGEEDWIPISYLLEH